MTGHHVLQPQFVVKFEAQLRRHPLVQPGQLELEVLESRALNDLNSVAKVIAACADLGVSFALDDFGTGYLALTYLKRLPAQVLKIYQSFIRDTLEDTEDTEDTEDLAIVLGVLGLASAFKRQAIAECAETRAHCQKLVTLGCDLAQGYGIARPMPAEEVAHWVAQWRPDVDWLD